MESKEQQSSYPRLTNEMTLGSQAPNDTRLAQNEAPGHGFISCKHQGHAEAASQFEVGLHSKPLQH